MFGMGALDPKKVKQVQALTENVKGEILVNYNDYTITVKFMPDNDTSAEFIKTLLPQFSETLANQLFSFFKIQGEIVEVGNK